MYKNVILYGYECEYENYFKKYFIKKWHINNSYVDEPFKA